MNIIFTCHTYYPKNDGVQFVTEYLAEGLVKKGHNVTVLTNWPKDRTDLCEEIHNGVKIYRINAFTNHTFHHGEKNKYKEQLISLCKKNDVLINVCTQCALTDWTLSILDEIQIPKVLYLHSIWDFKYNRDNFVSAKAFLTKIFCNIRWRLYYFINRNKLKKYNVVTQLHSMDYSNNFFKKKLGIDSLIIENAAENVFFDNSINSNIKLPSKYLINVSNYLKRKNQEKCIDLFLNSNIPSDWELILIGSKKNSYYDSIKKKYDLYVKSTDNPKKIHLLYDIPRENIPTYVKNASLYLMTSKWEAFPISLTECMAAKVPFISSNVGIVKFLPGGVCCDGDLEFKYWLNKFTYNDDLRKSFGLIGYNEALKRYNVNEKVSQLESVLFDLVGDFNENE